jgi:hypothetical protein
MLAQLLYGAALVAITVAINGLVLIGCIKRLRLEHDLSATGFVQATLLLSRLATWVILGHLAAILIWGGFYAWHGIVPSAELGFYFSAVTYATIGYGDIVPPESWRLLAAMEGLTGILMCTWSGGFFFAVVSRMYLPAAGSSDRAR